MIVKQRKKHELNNYDFCYGMKVNWVDMNTGKLYYIQEYAEAVERGEKPKGIKVAYTNDTDHILEVLDPVVVRERMKDPEPDPRY